MPAHFATIPYGTTQESINLFRDEVKSQLCVDVGIKQSYNVISMPSAFNIEEGTQREAPKPTIVVIDARPSDNVDRAANLYR